LFTYLETSCDTTSNKLEGGINTGIRYLLRHHRGLTPAKEKLAIQWYLWAKTHNTKESKHLIQPEHYKQQPKKKQTKQEQIGPKHIDKSYETTKTKTGHTWINLYE